MDDYDMAFNSLVGDGMLTFQSAAVRKAVDTLSASPSDRVSWSRPDDKLLGLANAAPPPTEPW